MITKGSTLKCNKCQGFKPNFKKAIIVDIGEFYLNFLSGAIDIGIYCKECNEKFRNKLFKFNERIKHNCKPIFFDRNLNRIDNREGFQLIYINPEILEFRKKEYIRKGVRKDFITQKFINFKLEINLKCLDCGEIINYKFNKEWRIPSFAYYNESTSKVKRIGRSRKEVCIAKNKPGKRRKNRRGGRIRATI